MGIAVKNISESKDAYYNLDFVKSKIEDIVDEKQKIKLSFLENNGVLFELVQALVIKI